MPRLWNDTITTHKASIREAILDAADRIIALEGISSLTMSTLAKETGIGRATLYKYYPDLDQVLSAWHQRQVDRHLEHLSGIASRDVPTIARLMETLLAFVRLRHGHHAHDMHEKLHRSSGVRAGEVAVVGLLAGIISEGQAQGFIRADYNAEELAGFCVGAVSHAGSDSLAQDRFVELAVEAMKP